MNGAVALACGCLAAATGLLVNAGPRVAVQATGHPRRWLWLTMLSAVMGTAVVARPSVAALVAVGLATAAAGARLWRKRAMEKAAATVRARVIECCDGLAAELSAGATPADAMARTAQEWDYLAPAARAAQVGGGVPAELQVLARRRGAGDLRIVAGAWQVAQRTGVGLAASLGRVAAELRAAEQTRRIVGGELASARATARLVAVLPLAALAMGSGAGANPWAFLVGTPLGLACLAGGLGCGVAGLTWIEAIAADVERGR